MCSNAAISLPYLGKLQARTALHRADCAMIELGTLKINTVCHRRCIEDFHYRCIEGFDAQWLHHPRLIHPKYGDTTDVPFDVNAILFKALLMELTPMVTPMVAPYFGRISLGCCGHCAELTFTVERADPASM
jgi:hypothetical protein